MIEECDSTMIKEENELWLKLMSERQIHRNKHGLNKNNMPLIYDFKGIKTCLSQIWQRVTSVQVNARTGCLNA